MKSDSLNEVDSMHSGTSSSSVDDRREKSEVEDFARSLAVKALANTLCYPLANIKVLMQIGFEPFPLVLGKNFGVGNDQYFLPNGLAYARNLSKAYSWTCLFDGFDANICNLVAWYTVKFYVGSYMDKHYPNYGGDPVNLTSTEDELDDIDSGRRALRTTVRDCTSQILAVIVARPFAVVMVRKVAQIIGNEIKYSGVIPSLILIGREEGPKGLFSGIVPQIIREFFTVVGINALMYLGRRFFKRIKDNYAGDENVAKMLKSTNSVFDVTVPMIVNNIFYSYDVVSTVMAVTGSCLVASMLPYSPVFGTWQEAWSYLDAKQGLSRGSRLFLRQYKGPVTIGPDGNVFASNKHFV